jgi:folate-binding protein YgfZ
MSIDSLHALHLELGARFLRVGGGELVGDYGDTTKEYQALTERAGVLDLSARSRLGLTGADRVRFLHGQVTNNVKDLDPGEGCYAALVTAKGKMVSDLNVYCLPDELRLDIEPGLARTVKERLEKYIIADDVQVRDVSPDLALFSVQGPQAGAVLRSALSLELPATLLTWRRATDAVHGDIDCVNHPRAAALGFDLFVPRATAPGAWRCLIDAARAAGGGPAGWNALEVARVEAGIPRFHADMDEQTLAPEAGIDSRAISYTKGCYIGQEVIARVRTYGQVARALRGLRLPDGLAALPQHGDKLLHDGKEAGFVTSAVASPRFRANLALGYVRRECNEEGTQLKVGMETGETTAVIVPLPFGSGTGS